MFSRQEKLGGRPMRTDIQPQVGARAKNVEHLALGNKRSASFRAHQRAGETEHEDQIGMLQRELEIKTTQVAEMRRKLNDVERLAELGQLIGSIVHELKNPIGTINTSVELIGLLAPRGDKDLTKAVEIIKRKVWEAKRIMDDVRYYARQNIMPMDKVDVVEAIEEVLEETEVPDRVRVVFEHTKADTMLSGDRARLKRAFQNLMSNAFFAMPEGGSLIISTSGIVIEEKGTLFVKVEVTDTGCGIAREDMDKIFEPIYSTRSEGFGLGLCIVQKIVEFHGGEIMVKSTLGKGTTFRLYFPTLSTHAMEGGRCAEGVRGMGG